MKIGFLLLLLFVFVSCGHMESGTYYQLKENASARWISKTFKVPQWMIEEANPKKKYKKGEWVFVPRRAGFMSAPKITFGKKTVDYFQSGKGKFAWPVPSSKKISSEFGRRWGRAHEGIDIPAKKGAHFLSVEAGVVIYADNELSGYGNLIVIAHKGGIFTVYAHAQKMFVRKGEKVHRGQVIGKVGMTGRVTGPHLHFEVRRDSKSLNPRSFLAKVK